MRIPTSVIVMGLLTAVPFGLAIRDAAKGHDKSSRHGDDDDDDWSPRSGHSSYDADDEKELRRAEAEMERLQAEERSKKLQTAERARKIVPQLVGSDPASLGTMFQGVKLGANAGNFQPDLVRQQVAEASDVIRVDWDVDSVSLNGITISLRTDDYSSDCAPLASALRTWGAKTHDDVWENPTTHQRAKFDEYGCSLKIERYTDLDHFLDRTDASIVPITAVGQAATKLRTRLGERVETDDETELSWQDIGPPGGFGRARIDAVIENGKIVTLSVTLPDGTDMVALAERISKLEGNKGKRDEDLDATRWTGRFQALLYEGSLGLVIGKQP